MPPARSLYSQVRLTVTEERGLWVTSRVMAKPVNADWTMKNVVHHSRVQIPEHSDHWMTLLHYGAADVLGQRLFPT